MCFYRTGDAQTAQVIVWTFIFPSSASSHICAQWFMLTLSIHIFIKHLLSLQSAVTSDVYERAQTNRWFSLLAPLLEKWHIYHVTVVKFNLFGIKVYLCWLFTAFVYPICTENGSPWCRLYTSVIKFLFLKWKIAKEINYDLSVTLDDEFSFRLPILLELSCRYGVVVVTSLLPDRS